MKPIVLFCLALIFLPIVLMGQEVAVFAQFNGQYDYVAFGNTLNIGENTGANPPTPCEILTTSSANFELQPDQVQTMYVHYKPQTRKYMVRMVRNQPMPDFYDRKAIFFEATDSLLEAGYNRAGFESFSKPDDVLSHSMEEGKALYNSLGTQSGDVTNFIAVGSSAHGCLGNDYYFQNYYEQNLYREALDKGEFPIYRGYKLDFEDKVRRDIIKRIRTYFTIDFPEIERIYNIDFKVFFSQELGNLEEFEKDNIIQINKDSFVLTEVGKHFSPQVASVFDAYLDRPLYDQNI